MFNLLGQRVATLVDGEQPAGFHTAAWAATDASGQAVGAGVYLYRLSGDGAKITRRMLLIDGQAGIPSGRGGSTGSGGEAATEEAGETAPAYGLTVSGTGLVPYVDPAFRVAAGMGVDLVVEVPTGAPRAKVASAGLLGDVDNTGRVDFFDALLVALYSQDSSIVMPNNGDVSLGDVNADGRVDLSDAWVIAAWLNDPSDPSLPSGIGEEVGPAASLSPDPSTVAFADDGSWHRFTVEAGEPVTVVVNPAGTPRGLEITTRSGRGNYCPAEADDDARRRNGQTIYLSGCTAGEATVELRRESDDTVLRSYTFEVSGSAADLVVEAVSTSDSVLTADQRFTLYATVRNQGTGAAAATQLRWYRSLNRTISTRDLEVGTAAVSALAASGTSAQSISLLAPPAEGTYYYGACVISVAGERAGNNCSVGFRVAVEAASPDLIVESVSISKGTLTPGETFTLRATVSNQGTGTAPATTLRWYRSSNEAISTRSTEVGKDAFGALAAGFGFKSISLTAPSSEGTYYYGACVAPVAGEADTRNNCSLGVPAIVEEADHSPVTIPDANLRAAIQRALGKASGSAVTVAEMRTLTGRLDLQGLDISDLTGLESAVNVRALWLNNNRRITDVAVLSALTNLVDLSLNGNRITDVSALSGLTRLQFLSLGSNNLADVSALSSLDQLVWLTLDNNSLTDVSTLAGLANLVTLWLNGNRITDISALADLTNLETLWLDGNNISDISALSGLTKLRDLDLNGSRIADVSVLSGLTQLNELGLGVTDITDISPLMNMVHLTRLELRGTPLNVSSINDHIPALEDRGVTVLFDASLRQGDFDIELIFLDSFTEAQERVIRYAAQRWMSIITVDLPDHEFARGWSSDCSGRPMEISPGERIDDLRIYVINNGGRWAGVHLLREESSLPVVGCMSVGGSGFDTEIHEIAHALGFGTVWDDLGFLEDPDDDAHFDGPLAIAAFDGAGGRDYRGAKVPVAGKELPPGTALSHWRDTVLRGELMGGAHTARGTRPLSAITIQSLADLGYAADVTQADRYALPGSTWSDSTLPQPSAKAVAPPARAETEAVCGTGLRRGPIHVVDRQGNIVGTLEH